jgi:hypothetical protein
LESRPETAREDLSRTPALERLLDGLRGRLVRQVWLHGLGTALAVAALWLAFAFFADWGLRVPHAVRLFHGAVLFLLVGFFAWRHLFRPLARIPSRAGLAILVERSHPDLHELLVSAVQLQGASAEGDAGLVAGVLAEADERARRLPLAGVLDERRPRRRALAGAAAAAVLALGALLNPLHTQIFLDRMFGGSAAWPQRTHLTVDVPVLDAGATVERSDERIAVRVARGTDVPVVVRAEGAFPDEVTLHFDGGRDLVLPSSGRGVYRTLLRSCQEDVEFHATGGDDLDGLPRVSIEVLQPPDVEGIAVAVRPPAYSGLADELAFNRDVEVLAGSALTIHVLPFPADATGQVRLLPDDVLVALVPMPFPPDPAQGDGLAEPRPGLGFELQAEKTVGYRVELVDGTGLSNPDPGLFRVRVLEDRPPEVQVVAPSRSDFEIVKGGAIPLRARAEDDFGLASMHGSVRPTTLEREEVEPVLEGTFELLPLEGATVGAAAERGLGARRQAALGSARIEVEALGTPAEPVAVDQRFTFAIVAVDDRQPEPGEGRAIPVRARVVTPEELLRRLQDRLAQARLAAIRLSDLQREKRARVEELAAAMEQASSLQTGEGLALAAALSGQRRVTGDARELARDLATVTEDVLYARLDDKAAALLEAWHERTASLADVRFHPEPWREVALAHREGRLGAGGFASNLVELVDLALAVGEDHAAAATAALERAESSVDVDAARAALEDAVELQTRCLEHVEILLERLAEWDNFQNILQLTRDILNRQKALRERTQQLATEK